MTRNAPIVTSRALPRHVAARTIAAKSGAFGPGGSTRPDRGNSRMRVRKPRLPARAVESLERRTMFASATADLGEVTPLAAHHWFTVAYTDDVAIDSRTIGSGDVEVTGPGGYAQPGTLSNLTQADGQWTATYRVPAPGGSWNAADNGTYTVSVRAGEVSNGAGDFVPAGPIGQLQVDLGDVAAPTASLLPGDVTAAGTHHWFTVVYADDVAVDRRTIGAGDVYVTTPGGATLAAALANLSTTPYGRSAATYRVAAPGGRWDVPDGGTYTVRTYAGAVSDTAGKSVRTGWLGQFAVRFADTTGPTAVLSIADITTDAGHHYFQVAYSDNDKVDFRTIDGFDLEVEGPFFSTPLVPLSYLSYSAGTWVATYRVDGRQFGNRWVEGTYRVMMLPGRVKDVTGNFVPAGLLGTFRATDPEPSAAPPTAAAPAAFSDVAIAARGHAPARQLQSDATDLLR